MENDPHPPADSGYMETLASPPSGPQVDGEAFSKEQRDIALAACALQSGVLNERQLAAALASWTIHGNTPLEEHLQQQGLLSAARREQLVETARERLSQAVASLSRSEGGLSQNGTGTKSVVLETLDAIDPSGTVARLMGIRAIAGAGAFDATGKRESAVRFRLVRKLGQGGLGRVWLAFDESLKRHVAVKEITAKNNADAMERFRREAEITGRLEHPGIVPIYQLGEDAQTGEVFYAMRFLGRTTMHDSIAEYHERRNEGDDDPMLIRRLLTDFVNVCQAIGHAHSRKVIHRDLKPENVAIDSFGQVIVIDWGIAKVIDDVTAGDHLAASTVASASGSTMEGQVLGTPLYMAPEQAAGRVDELDERTDIYGLGAILFAILTGYAPHERTREASGATNGRQLLAAITSRPAPNARETNHKVDPALAAICAKAMARRQYARYQSACELADDVQRWMAGERVSAYREKPAQRITRWIAQHRIWSQVIAVACTVGIVALTTFAIASWRDARAHHEMRIDDMRGYAREVEFQTQSTAVGLAKNTRFMSTLPPIQGIIDARDGTTDNQLESEEVWRERLETIFEGLLRANPNYLAVTFAALEGADQGQGIVRVERNVSDASYVRRVPLSRLGAFAHTEVYGQTTTLPPGEILMAISEERDATSIERQNVRLIAATPVYSERTGKLFGIVAVEENLLARLGEIVEGIEQRDAIISVTDADGNVWLRDGPDEALDAQQASDNLQAALPPATTDSVREDSAQGRVAQRIQLAPANPETTIGVVIQMFDR